MKDLLAPRFKVIADYPNSPYKVGDVLYYNETLSILSYTEDSTAFGKHCKAEKYPDVFRKLGWWEERTVNELPKYFRNSNGVFELGNKAEYFAQYNHKFLPATEEEYIAYKEVNK